MSETSLDTSPTDDQSLAATLADAWDEIATGAGQEDIAGEETGTQELEADASTEDLTAEGTAEGSADQADEGATSEAAVNAVEAPSDFTAEEKEQWSKLTPEAQTLLASYSNRSQVSRTTIAKELDGLKTQYGPLGDTLKQYDQHLRMLGASPNDVVSGLMPYYIRLAGGDAETKRETIEFLARQFGAELGAPQEQENQEYVDPEIKALRDELNELKQGQRQSQQTAEQQRLAAAQAEVDTFKNAKDEKGELKYPHFDKLEQSMIGLLKGGLATTKEDAYAKAAALDPEIQAAAQQAKAEAERKRQNEAAKNAKAAAALNKAGTKAPATQNGSLSVSDSVREAYDELYG